MADSGRNQTSREGSTSTPPDVGEVLKEKQKPGVEQVQKQQAKDSPPVITARDRREARKARILGGGKSRLGYITGENESFDKPAVCVTPPVAPSSPSVASGTDGEEKEGQRNSSATGAAAKRSGEALGDKGNAGPSINVQEASPMVDRQEKMVSDMFPKTKTKSDGAKESIFFQLLVSDLSSFCFGLAYGLAVHFIIFRNGGYSKENFKEYTSDLENLLFYGHSPSGGMPLIGIGALTAFVLKEMFITLVIVCSTKGKPKSVVELMLSGSNGGSLLFSIGRPILELLGRLKKASVFIVALMVSLCLPLFWHDMQMVLQAT
eukprot:Nk52_evm1s1064 gene=Nk52_evmTU1s1064